MDVSITKKGWTITVTNRVYGMLEQGGRSGMRRFYSFADLEEQDIARDTDPEETCRYNDPGMSVAEWVWECMAPTRILSHGTKIE